MRRLSRILKLISVPIKMAYAYMYPESYAKNIGVRMLGKVKLFGNSYYTFGAEPYLITLGDNVFISTEVRFMSHDGAVLIFNCQNPTLDIVGPITVGNNVFIGSGSKILQGVNIGDDVIVGAGSVVTKNVESGFVVAGNPAKFIKYTKEYLKDVEKHSIGFGAFDRSKRAKMYKDYFNKNENNETS